MILKRFKKYKRFHLDMEYTLIKTDNVNELVKEINKAKGLVIVEGSSDTINRFALENKKVNILLSPEKERDRDFTHYRNSGLNHVLCNLAHKNDIAIGFDFNDVLNSKDMANVLGRMMQNVRLCRKYKVKMLIFDFTTERTKEELRSFGLILGMTPGEVNQTVNFKKL